ncbi:MAG TPA: hypothetical protein VF297_03330 [Pyrinomonadaceae bacterium]
MMIFSVALLAFRVLRDACGGVHVDAYLIANVAFSESQQQAEEECLKILLDTKPVSEGWTSHTVRTVPIPLEEFIDRRIDELLDRRERGEPSELAPDSEFVTDSLQ